MTKVRHILGISGGKDSAALSIYLKQKYPQLKIEYYNSDTGCELAETELLIDRLSAYLGNIKRLRAAEGSPEPTPFEHVLKAMGGFPFYARGAGVRFHGSDGIVLANGTFV